MNLAEFALRKSVITWVLTALMVVIGWQAFNGLSRLEDPEFTIKDAVVVTPYPGASAAEVEEEVSNTLEKAIQQMGELDRIESTSTRGLSTIKVTIKDKYDKSGLPQVWDTLRRKVGDAQLYLPPGAGPSLVNDDFGDVYGVFFALTGEGYTYAELRETAKMLQKELLQVQDVKRISLYGEQPEVIYIEMRRAKMSELGVSTQDIYTALQQKNLPVTAGHITLGEEYLPVNPTGEFQSEQEFGDLLIASRGSDALIYLRDVAEISRGYQEPAKTILRANGAAAIGIAISTIDGGNVVTMGDALQVRLAELRSQMPLGMDLHTIAMQPEAVTLAINSFLINLGEAVLIVVLVLLVFMGMRSALIIGAILLATIMGTFIVMQMQGITLERISLGALVIALGMLVDNAIVVTDGMRMKMARGESGLEAAKSVVGQTAIPLLGATVVAVMAFAAIGTSQDATGEYCRSLFLVILISLMMSWLTAVTSTPLLCNAILKKGSSSDDGEDQYGGKFYDLYRTTLTAAIRYRWVTIAIVVGMFVSALLGFGFVKKSFFPASTRPQFLVDFYFPAGTHIDQTMKQMEQAEEHLAGLEGVSGVATFGGGGQVRFLLTYTPESRMSNFAQILVSVDDYKKIPNMIRPVQNKMSTLFPEASINTKMFVNGPATGGKIQLRIYGPDAVVLRSLMAEAKAIFLDHPNTKAVRDEWDNQVKVLRPQMAETRASRAGITRPMLASALESALEGKTIGVYREGDDLLPIIARSPESERRDFDSLQGISVWSPVAGRSIPMGQVVNGFNVEFEDPAIGRRNRRRMIRLHTDPNEGLPSLLFAELKPAIEKVLNVDVATVTGRRVKEGDDPFANFDASTIKVRNNALLPLKDMPGYYMSWGGEAEDSARSSASLMGKLPIFFGLMMLIVLALFNSIKKTLIIWLCVPLAIIGVTAGLLLLGQPFGFMSMLGLLSLAGMLIKNAIVLIDQIGLDIDSGKDAYQSIVDSGVSRLIPVSMAALTTILGMLPLVQDAFFISMAVTIMFGLAFATVLTLLLVPVLFAIFYKVASPAS